MSLSYYAEHLAWQQRVIQEKNRANTFEKTSKTLYEKSPALKLPFPNANQDLVPKNYKSLNYNLSYTFGGTKPIKYATIDSPIKKNPRLSRSLMGTEFDSEEKELKRKFGKYANQMINRIIDEKQIRAKLERSLKKRNKINT